MPDAHPLHAWLIAIRPHTLPAAGAPVIVGTGLAISENVFSPGPMVAALLGALLLQIGTNLANDYYDAEKGADTVERNGFTRVTQTGLIPPARVKAGMYLTYGLAILTGTYLVYVGGLPILVVGLASVLAGLLYTGGPYPYGYYGLGDVFVFVFFGLIAVTGSYYVQAITHHGIPVPLAIPPGLITATQILVSIPMAALITDILVVNNIRDIPTDKAAGKRTLAVIIGYSWSRIEFLLNLGLAYLIPLLLLARGYSYLVLLPLITIPYAGSIAKTVLTETTGTALNPALEQTGKLTILYAVAFAIGLAL